MPVALSFSETGEGPNLVILHGLFGSKRNWSALAKQLGRTHRVLTVDLRNHGESPWTDTHTYEAMAGDLAMLIEDHCHGKADVIGHSMGGKTAMMLALLHPETVDRLMIVDIAPAPSGGTLIEFIQTMRDLDLSSMTRRSEVEAALADTIPEPSIRAFLAHNVSMAGNRLSWQINLATLEAEFDAIMGFPDLDSDQAFDGETLFVAGEKSDYIQPFHKAEIDRLFPNSDIEVIPNAGHWVHAEAPGAFLQTVSGFLDEA